MGPDSSPYFFQSVTHVHIVFQGKTEKKPNIKSTKSKNNYNWKWHFYPQRIKTSAKTCSNTIDSTNNHLKTTGKKHQPVLTSTLNHRTISTLPGASVVSIDHPDRKPSPPRRNTRHWSPLGRGGAVGLFAVFVLLYPFWGNTRFFWPNIFFSFFNR